MRALTDFVAERLTALGDPDKARHMAAYMKTEMPFYGVQAAARRSLAKEAEKRFPISTQEAYEKAILSLWQRPHREEKYVAIALARRYAAFVHRPSLPLYERLIREGAWWDFVDEIAQHLVGDVLAGDPDAIWPVIDRWIDDENLWIRRTAILCQNRFKDGTDEARLFRYCLRRAAETDFFIRKGIGWALRQYSYTAPKAVQDFLVAHEADFSTLTKREGSKVLAKRGSWKVG